MSLRILHVAVENFCGIPLELVKAHRRFGHDSRLVTWIPSRRGYEDDLCLHYPLVGSGLVEELKEVLGVGTRIRRVEYGSLPGGGVDTAAPDSVLGRTFFELRDRLWRRKLLEAEKRWHLFDYDIYHLEGGLGFLRSGGIVRQLKDRGKKIVSMYYGSDLRLRGYHPVVRSLEDISLTIEYDHITMDPTLEFLFLPLDVSRFDVVDPGGAAGPVRIGHSPTRRELKGTSHVLRAVGAVGRRHPVELVLIEGMPHDRALEAKASCHVFVDQVGNTGGTGYGVSSVESLAMGIPTITDFAPDLEAFLPDHPFVLATPATLEEKIESLVVDPALRRRKGSEARDWVVKHHHADRVVERIYELYGERGWLGAGLEG
jgi:hypothetical protein